MALDDKRNSLSNVISEDFNVMRKMLSEIELKILGVDQLKQRQFYHPIREIILEAWRDACNSNDSFLFSKNNDDENK